MRDVFTINYISFIISNRRINIYTFNLGGSEQMRKIADLLYDKLGSVECFALKDLSIKYHCPTIFDLTIDIIGLSYGLFWLGVIAGSAIVKLDMLAYELCGKAQAVISKELLEIYHSAQSN